MNGWQAPLNRKTSFRRLGTLSGIVGTVVLSACSWRIDEAPTDSTVGCVDDVQVQSLGDLKPALVYVWSPRMVMAVLEAYQAKAAADERGLRFIPLADGRIPRPEWQAALQRAETLSHSSAKALSPSVALCSPMLVSRLAYRHSPTGFLVWQGKVHPAPLVGTMPQAFWSEAIRLRMNDWQRSATVKLQNPEGK